MKYTFSILALIVTISGFGALSARNVEPHVVAGFIGHYESLERIGQAGKFSDDFKAVYQAFKAGETEIDDELFDKVVQEALAFSGVKFDPKRGIRF